MNLQIHLSIAHTLKKIVEEELSIKLNTPAFMYGSIKPDLLPHVITAEHEIKFSKNFIVDEIKSLLGENIEHRRCSWNYSERLGIITHYLSDFFCHAHSEFYSGNTLEHYLYEFKHSMYSNKSYKSIIKKLRNFTSVYQDMNSIDTFLEQQYSRYILKSPSAARDLIYSLLMCATICISIIATHSQNLDLSAYNTQALLLQPLNVAHN